MASVEQRLQMKREPLDKWSVREQLCLASAVARSGDQNWMSVSRALKPFGDSSRPLDWFHQKNCAAQYGALLSNVETPKRKKRTSAGDYSIETPAESILRQLKAERLAELKKLLQEEKAEYLKLQENMTLLTMGKFTEEQLDKWCKEIDEEEYKKEQENLRHTQWLKEREMKKQEIERVWRPNKLGVTQAVIGQKRKNSDSLDSLLEHDQLQIEDNSSSNSNPPLLQEIPKTSLALSPLLTSLLKSPSQVQNMSQTSILHSAITNQRPLLTANSNINNTNTATNPMIASLLNSTANVAVSPGLQQLVTTAIGNSATDNVNNVNLDLATPDILDDETLRNLKIEDIANSIIVPDGPLPEMKNDVDVIISDLIADPEQHLQLDNNGDININLELDDLDENEEEDLGELVEGEQEKIVQVDDEVIVETVAEVKEVEKVEKITAAPIDPFEFQEDPEYEPKILIKQSDIVKQTFLPNQSSSSSTSSILPSTSLQVATQQTTQTVIEPEETSTMNLQNNVEKNDGNDCESLTKSNKKELTSNSGSVEIVEVAMEEEEVGKVLNKSEIQDIVHSSKTENLEDETKIIEEKEKLQSEEVLNEQQPSSPAIIVESSKESGNSEVEEATSVLDIEIETEVKEEELKVDNKEEEQEKIKRKDEEVEEVTIVQNISLDKEKSPESVTVEQNFPEELYDDIQMEVKVDKTGKAKRDYSRTKKKEEKDFDILLAIEKAHMEENELLDDLSSDKEIVVKKEEIKSENERSNSPWTEEEDIPSKRRISTPATPCDSVPNSPASSNNAYDDDKDYKNWKKSIMLVYSWLAAHKYSSLFLKPITEDQAPGYHSLIHRPMDFQTIRKNIENGAIRSTQEFKRDVMLMLNNAIMYNKTNGTVYNMTREIQQEAVESIQLLLQAQSSNEDTPPRRETRTSEPGLKRKRGPEGDINARTSKKQRKED